MNQYKVVGIGELLWDILPQGKQLGGAPCNFAYHSFQAGCQPFVISALGNDNLGNEILERFDDFGLKNSYVQRIADFPTGTVTVSLDNNGIPTYIIHENVAWDHIVWNSSLETLAQSIDAVCFGSLAQRNHISQQTILKFLETTGQDCLKVFDINLRQQFYNIESIIQSLKYANILKMNDVELPILANLLELHGSDHELLSQLIHKFNLRCVALTKGDKGSILMTDKEETFMKVPKVKIADTIGAGDSFTAILVTGLLKNVELEKIHSMATQVAAFVCTQKGASPQLPKYLLKF